MKRLIACAVALLLLVSCAPFSHFERYEATWYDVFDTVTVLRGYAESRADFDRIANAAHRVLLEYHTLFDIYHDADVPNLKTVNAAGKNVTQLMAEKDMLTLRLSVLRDTYDTASSQRERYSRSEIKIVTVIDVKKLSKQIDDYASQLRRLDVDIQALNFQTDLI